MIGFNRKQWSCSALLVVGIFAVGGFVQVGRAQTFSNAGFGAELVTSFPPFGPISVTWSPDGRMFIIEKNGIIRIFKNGALLSTPFLDFSSKVNTYNDNGMWGLAFDPNFPANGFIYLSYVYEPNGNPNDSSPKIARLVRVTANPGNPDVMLAGSEVALLDNLPDDAATHAIGTIRFATDGTMFVGNGDGASPYGVDPNAIGAQDLNNVRGKFYRLNVDGTAPTDNPFYDGTDSVRSKVWCYGVRNPYRFSLHPVTGVPYFADVGWDSWEEINQGTAGGNYGWPCYEGLGPQPLYQSALAQCTNVTSVIEPIVTYSHTDGDLGQGGTCIIGGDFYTGNLYPQAYQGNYFYADYSGNWIHRVVLDANGNVVSNATFATGISGPTCVQQGPDGMLYYVAFATGEIRRIRFNGPVAVASATPTYGYSPLLVSFSSAGSTNSAGGSLTYSWNFGDGATSILANPSHTYTTNAVVTFTAVLTVKATNNQTSTALVKITVGSSPPHATISTPAERTSYLPGQTVFFQGSGTDPDQGALPASALSWTVLLHHNTHVHTGIATNGSQGSFVVQDHGSIGTFYYEIILTATDSSGLTGSTNVNIQVIADSVPPTTPTSLLATPLSGGQVRLNWSPATDNAGIGGYQVERQSPGSTNFVEVGLATATTYTDTGVAPNTNYNYRVRAVDASGNTGPYSNVAPATTPAGIPGLVAAYSFNEGVGTTAADASGNSNTGTLLGAGWTTLGKFGNALSFDGTSRVTVNDSSSLDLTTTMTLEAWIFPTAVPSGYSTALMKEQTGEMVYTLYAGTPANRPNAIIFTTAEQGVVGPSALAQNTWSHLAETYDGATLRLYVNGTQVASTAISGSIITSTGPFSIGGNEVWGEYFQGRIDEVRVYNRVLSAAQIQADMSAAIGNSTSNRPPTMLSITNQSTAMNTPTAAISFTVDDPDTGAGSLTVSGVSSNLTLVPNANITFGGSGANRTVTVTPATGQAGTGTITVTVSDGSLTTSSSFVLTVTGGGNTPPTISSIGNQVINEDTVAGPIGFIVSDIETPAGSLTMSGVSSNLTLVPNGNITFGGSGSNRTVTVTPAANQNGTTLITVTVSDGSLSSNASFLVTVNAVNDPPTISSIGSQVINEDTVAGPIAFIVGDVETAAGSLTVSGVSSNLTLVPNGNITFGGSGSNRTVTVTPAANQNGTTLITVAVSDGSLSSNASFLVTVNPVNDPPTISSIGNQMINEDTVAGPVGFIVGDVETAAGSLTVSGVSSNLTLVPNGNITFGGSGANRTVTVTPAANQNGTTLITVAVSDGSLSSNASFLVTVNPVNDPPTISSIGNQMINEDTVAGPVGFIVGDVETAAGSLTVSGVSSNLTLVPNGNITFGGSGSNRTVTVTPAANQNGTTLITVAVSDGSLSSNASFLVTVNPVNDPPTISSIGDQVINEDTPTAAIPFVVDDIDNPVGSLTVSGVSSNLTLVPNGNITFGGSGSNRTVTVTPAANQNGTTLITVTVSDGSLSSNASFLVTVNAVNDPPTISSIGDQVINEDTIAGPIGFIVGDVETPAGSLTVSGVSSNLTLVPNGNITFGGSDSNRTVTVTPAAGQTGTTLITVSVSDGQLTSNAAFAVTVNTPPVLPPFVITTITLSGTSDVNIVWNGRQGTNVVQVSSGDGIGQYTGIYLDLGSNLLSGVGVTNYTDTGGATNGPSRYYRIKLIQP